MARHNVVHKSRGAGWNTAHTESVNDGVVALGRSSVRLEIHTCKHVMVSEPKDVRPHKMTVSPYDMRLLALCVIMV
jgi:hypothetical protein